MPSSRFSATSAHSVRRRIGSAVKKAAAARAAHRVGPHRSFRLTPKSSYKGGKAAALPAVPRTWTLLKKTGGLLRARWKAFAALGLAYLVLSWLLIGLPDASQYGNVRELLEVSLGEEARSLTGAATLIASAASGLLSPTKSDFAQFVTLLLSLIFSLSYIWVARQHLVGNETSARQALYNAPAPIVVVALLLFLLVVQLLPGAIGALLLSYTFGLGGVAVTGAEAVLLALGGLLLLLLSLYLVVPTVIALIVATLPNTYPMEALRSARLLTHRRRAGVLVRLTGLGAVLLVGWALLVIPVVLFEVFVGAPESLPLVQIVLDLATAAALPVATVYTYQLYRELL